MSQLVLDDQLDAVAVLRPVLKWSKAVFVRDLRPREHIRDERIPEILLTVRQPTLVTIDHDFWKRSWCHPGYGIISVDLTDEEQHVLPAWLRALLRRPEFRTRALRMGKVVRVDHHVR